MIFYNKYALNVSIFFLCLMPAALIAGPAVVEFSSFSIIISTLIISRFNGIKINIKNKLIKFLFLYYFFILILSFFNNTLLEVFGDHFFYFRYIFLSLSIWYLLNENDKLIYYFGITFISVLIFLILDASFQYFYGKNILAFENAEVNRNSGLFNDELILGSYISRFFAFVFGLIYINKYLKNKKLILAFFTLLAFFGVFISGERTALGLIIISFFLISIKKDLRKFSLLLLLGIIFIISISSFFNKSQRYRVFIEPFHQMSLLSSNLLNKYSDVSTNYSQERLTKFYIFSEQHNSHFVTAYNMFVKNKIFGIGPDNFRVECKNKNYAYGDNPCSTHPHNLLIQILAETGLVGLIFYIIVFSFILKEIFVNFNKSNVNANLQYFILIHFFINLWPFFPSGNFFNNWMSYILYLPLGFYMHFKYSKK